MQGKSITTIDKRVGLAIRKYRKQAGISQTDLGEAIGVSFQQIQKYESGTNRITIGKLVAVGKILQKTLDELVYD